jgi:hypothetical protein
MNGRHLINNGIDVWTRFEGGDDQDERQAGDPNHRKQEDPPENGHAKLPDDVGDEVEKFIVAGRIHLARHQGKFDECLLGAEFDRPFSCHYLFSESLRVRRQVKNGQEVTSAFKHLCRDQMYLDHLFSVPF